MATRKTIQRMLKLLQITHRLGWATTPILSSWIFGLRASDSQARAMRRDVAELIRYDLLHARSIWRGSAPCLTLSKRGADVLVKHGLHDAFGYPGYTGKDIQPSKTAWHDGCAAHVLGYLHSRGIEVRTDKELRRAPGHAPGVTVPDGLFRYSGDSYWTLLQIERARKSGRQLHVQTAQTAGALNGDLRLFKQQVAGALYYVIRIPRVDMQLRLLNCLHKHAIFGGEVTVCLVDVDQAFRPINPVSQTITLNPDLGERLVEFVGFDPNHLRDRYLRLRAAVRSGAEDRGALERFWTSARVEWRCPSVHGEAKFKLDFYPDKPPVTTIRGIPVTANWRHASNWFGGEPPEFALAELKRELYRCVMRGPYNGVEDLDDRADALADTFPGIQTLVRAAKLSSLAVTANGAIFEESAGSSTAQP
jgi:hypothetical protein